MQKRTLIVQVGFHGAHPVRGLLQIQTVEPEDVRMAGCQENIRGTVFDNIINGPGIKIIIMFVRLPFFQGTERLFVVKPEIF